MSLTTASPLPVGADSRAPSPRQPSILIVAWEYPGVNSPQGTALARRIGQLARSFARHRWRVCVVHRAQQPNDPAIESEITEPLALGGSIRRRAVVGRDAKERRYAWLTPLRKVVTVWVAFRHGDRSGFWAAKVQELARDGEIERPDLILACFTPRGPLRAAERLHRFWNVQWIADLQDPWWEGSSTALRPIVARWMRRVLRSAALIVQVSPEWAANDAKVLRRLVETKRHAVATLPRLATPERDKNNRSAFVVLYAGSLDRDCQDLDAFMDALAHLHERDARDIEVHVAGSEAVWREFSASANARGLSGSQRWLGWLSHSDLVLAAQNADCLLLVPWFTPDRQGVPSKLFEYIAFDTPTLIAGRDSGGITRVLAEWGHPPVVADTVERIVDVLARARRADPSGLLHRDRCLYPPLSEDALGEWYVERASSILSATTRHRV